MCVFKCRDSLWRQVKGLKKQGLSIGFVPTMGALHEGHLALVRQALGETDRVVVSIFINPTQFDQKADLLRYPKTLSADLGLLSTVSSKLLVYAPTVSDVYPEGERVEHFDFEGLDQIMEGQFRVNHFSGVATVVKRLFEIVKPDSAFFGEKDFQQLQIIRKWVELNAYPVQIISCPIVREQTGLALSSRNRLLSDEHRQQATLLYHTLVAVREKCKTQSPKTMTAWVVAQFRKIEGFELDYFLIVREDTLTPVEQVEQHMRCRAFIAATIGGVRLIDNMPVWIRIMLYKIEQSARILLV